ncbi:Acylphosphatase-like domain-containing protein, partial [Cryomyces antarcticus]
SYTVKQANSLGVTGFVKNASDGTVVGEAQGDESKLDEFLKHLNSGPSAASVNKVDHSDIGVKQGEKGFSQ